jgi:molybdenum cofactor synthesis domain-containing protein
LEEGLGAFRIGVLTVSDTRTPETDASGPAVAEALVAAGAVQIETNLVRDDIDAIKGAISEMASRCDVVFTTGGTGFSPRDVTPEATAPLLDKWAHSLVELVRLKGSQESEFAYASRGIAGVTGHALVVNLPGSPAGAAQGIAALLPILPHVLGQIQGDGH